MLEGGLLEGLTSQRSLENGEGMEAIAHRGNPVRKRPGASKADSEFAVPVSPVPDDGRC